MSCIVTQMDIFLCISALAVFFAVGQTSPMDYCSPGTHNLPTSSMCPIYDRLYPVYEKVEGALVSNPEILYRMQQAFFPTLHIQLRPVEIVIMEPCIEVDTFNCTDNSTRGNYVKCWQLQWSNSPLLNVITVDELLAFENVLTSALYSRIAGSSLESIVKVPIHIDTLPCTVSERDILQVFAIILSQSKSYAKSRGKPVTWEQEDRGYISMRYDYYVSERDDVDEFGARENFFHHIRLLLLMTFIVLNISNAVIIVKFAPKLSQKLNRIVTRSVLAARIYWAAAIILTMFNTAYVAGTIGQFFGQPVSQPSITGCLLKYSVCVLPSGTSLYEIEVVAVAVKLVIIPITFLAELLVAIYASKSATISSPSVTKSYCCCLSPRRWIRRFLQTLALWNFMIFIQIMAGMASLSICIFLIISPAQTISLIGIVALVLVSLTAATSYLLHHCTRHNMLRQHCFQWKSCGILCVKLTEVVLFLLFVVLISTLYLLVLQYTTDNLAGIVRLSLSLAPSVLVSAIGWAVKQRIFLSGEEEDTNRMRLRELQGGLEIQGQLNRRMPEFEFNEDWPNSGEEGRPLLDAESDDFPV